MCDALPDRHVLSAVTSTATAPVTAATLAITSTALALAAAAALALALAAAALAFAATALALALALALATAALALAAPAAITVAITSTALAITSAALALALALTLALAAIAAATLALAAATLAAAALAAAALHRRGDIGGFGRRERLHALGARLDRKLLRGGGQRPSLVRSSHSHLGLRTPGAEHRRRHARGCSDSRGGPRAGFEQRRQCLGDAASGPLRHRHARGAAHRVVAVDAAGGVGGGITGGGCNHRNRRGLRRGGALYGAVGRPASWLVQARTSDQGCKLAQGCKTTQGCETTQDADEGGPHE